MGLEHIRRSDENISFVEPPYYDDENACVWTRVTIRGQHGTRVFDVGCWHFADSFWLTAAGTEFEGDEQEQAWQHLKDLLVSEADELDEKLDWLA